jgi:hypothetical protein
MTGGHTGYVYAVRQAQVARELVPRRLQNNVKGFDGARVVISAKLGTQARQHRAVRLGPRFRGDDKVEASRE